ncbi:MAG: hypothetical protein ACK2U3_09500 [Anaerolineales bacterium]|jgi:hypothetical protein
MTPRKETPDLLSEMLGSQSQAGSEVNRVQGEFPAPVRAPRRKPRKPQPQKFEYIIVTFQDHRGLRPRFENGREYKNWMELPLIHDYLNDLSSEGWHLVSACAGESMYGSFDRHHLYFKRLIS